jgi:transposase
VGDRIEVPLGLDGFEVISSEEIDGTLEVTVRSTHEAVCHGCGSLDVAHYDSVERRVRDRGCGYPTVLRWRQCRARCSDCGKVTRERHPQIAGRRSITKRFRHRLFERAVHGAFSDVAGQESVSIYRVVEAFDWHSVQELSQPLNHAPEVIHIDESSVKKRYRYMTLLFDAAGAGAFDAAEGRSEASAAELLARLSPQVRAGIKAAVMDLHWPYRKAVERCLADATVVADRFHVHVAISKAANRVRRRSGRRTSIAGPWGGTSRSRHPRFERIVLDTKWTFMKRAHRLSADERAELDVLFEAFPEMGVAWLMREAFLSIYESPDRVEAERRLEMWVSHLPVADLPEITRVWTGLLKRWREPILAYLDVRETNAFPEGLTNQIKVLKRISFGFRNAERYRRKVLLACGRRRRGRPPPPSFA